MTLNERFLYDSIKRLLSHCFLLVRHGRLGWLCASLLVRTMDSDGDLP